MSRAIAAVVVIACAFVFAQAQPTEEPEPLKTVEQSGEWVWLLAEKGDVPLKDILLEYSKARELIIVADEKKMPGEISWLGVKDAALQGEEIDLFVANGLQDFRLVLVSAGGNQRQIVPVAEAYTRAPVLTEEELAKANPATWATVHFTAENIDPSVLRGELLKTTQREGGTVNPVYDSGVVICDRVDRLREVIKLARRCDAVAAREVRAYDVPEGVKPAEAVRTLTELFSHDKDQRPPTFSVAPDGKRVMARARTPGHEEIAKAIEAMK